MRLSLILCCAILFSLELNSQEYLYFGNVIDAISKLPVKDVNITDINNGEGTTTNEKGYFSIQSKSRNLSLEISHIAYSSRILGLKYEDFSDSSVVIQLFQKNYDLAEIVISDKQFETIYFKNNQSVIDYDIAHGRVFLLVKDYYEKSITLLSLSESLTDTVIISTPFKPKCFFKDIYNNLNIISQEDSAYQIIVGPGDFTFQKPIDHNKLLLLSQLYKFKINDKYFFSQFNSVEDELDFGFKTQNSNENIFYNITDDDKIEYYYDELLFRKIIPNTAIYNRRKLVTKYYNHPALFFDRKYMYEQMQNVFFNIGSDIYVVDNLKNILIHFDKSGKKIEIKEIINEEEANKINDAIQLKGTQIWKYPLIVDQFSNKLFLAVLNKQKTDLVNFDVEKGSLSFVTTLPHIFPKKILVNKGDVYYLYQKTSSVRNFGLFRTKL
jgi:hypothetical protein